VWIYTGNKYAKFHGNILSLRENIAKSFGGATFFDSHWYKKGTNGTKWAFCGLQNTPKSVFGLGSAPDPAGGAHDAPPDPLVGWRGDTHSPYPTPLGTDPPSALAMRPPEVQPDLRLCVEHRAMKFECSMGFSAMTDRIVWRHLKFRQKGHQYTCKLPTCSYDHHKTILCG